MSAPALRPLGIGEILDVGIKIYWRNAWTLFRIVLFLVLPAQILVNVLQISALPAGTTLTGGGMFGPSFDTSSSQTLSGTDAATFGVAVVAGVLITALAGKLAQAACFRAVVDAYLGEQVSWKDSIRYAIRRLPAVVAVSILTSIIVGIGTVFCIVPGIYFWVAFYVAIPVVLVEGAGPFKALGRSRELVRGRWWGTFGVALVGYVLVFLVASALTAAFVGLVLTGPQSTAVGFVVNTLSSTIASVLTTPAAAAFATVLYIDLRVRKEGFDLLLLAQRLGVAPRADAVSDLLPPSAPGPDEEQPPFWPPPPGWQPSGIPPSPPTAAPQPEGDGSQPPFWPPPPGWQPTGDTPTPQAPEQPPPARDPRLPFPPQPRREPDGE